MKKALKRSLSLLLAITIIFGSVYVGLSEVDFEGLFAVKAKAITKPAATSGACGDNLRWNFNNGTLTISGTGNMTNYSFVQFDEQGYAYTEIPWYGYSIKSVVIENGVTSIGSSAFWGCENLASITIPDNITTIGSYAFYNCTNLSSITMSPNIISIGNDAFYNTYFYNQSVNWDSGALYIANNLIEVKTSVTGAYSIRNGTKVISACAFYECTNLTSVKLPESLITIGGNAFSYCKKLITITIPTSVTNIGNSAFSSCSSLEKVYWNARNVVDFTENSKVFEYAGTSDSEIQVVFGDTVERIPEYFNYNNRLWCSSFGKNLISIGDYAYIRYKNAALTIPDKVTSIGMYAFANNQNLISILIPDNVENIGFGAFDNTAYYNDSANWEDEVLYIDNHLIKASTSITGDYIIKAGTKTIGASAFDECVNLTRVLIPDSVTTIGYNAFMNCRDLSSVLIGENVARIDDGAFYCCVSLNSVVIPDSVESIGVSAFNGCTSLVAVTIGNGVTAIYDYAFENCPNISSLVIGNGVTTIGDYAFEDCQKLESVLLPENLVTIGDSAFHDCLGITEIVIPNSVTTIGNYPFPNSLETVTIGVGVKRIGQRAFQIENLEKVYWNARCVENLTDDSEIFFNAGNSSLGIDFIFGNTVERIPAYLFYVDYYSTYYSNIKSLTIAESVTSIGDYAFANCPNIKHLYWNAKRVDDFTSTSNVFFNSNYFNDNPILKVNLVFGDSVEKIPSYLFYVSGSSFAPYTSSVTISDSITSIGEYAFKNGSGSVYVTDLAKWCNISFGNVESNPARYLYLNGELVTDLIIPESVTEITFASFYNCKSLKSITIPGTVDSIGESSFRCCNSLDSVYLSDSAIDIMDYAFYECTNLGQITNLNSIKSIGFNAFHNTAFYNNDINWENGVLYIGAHLVDADTSVVGSYFVRTGTKSICDYAFEKCEKLTTITIPEGVTSIGDFTFNDCQNLESVVMPESVSYIGYYAFSDCTKLKKVYITDLASWCNIKFEDAYSNPLYNSCNNNDTGLYLNGEVITELVIPEGVNQISFAAFYNYSQLTSVTIPDSVVSIGKSAFYNCDNLQYAFFTGSKGDWDNITFGEYNTPLTNLAIHYNSTDHTVIKDKAVAPTCTTKGNTEGSHCSVCNKVFVAITTIEATGHSYSDWELVEAPTCTGSGLVERVCGNCGNREETTACYVEHLVDSKLYPESSHDYESDLTKKYNFSYSGARSLILTFSNETKTEENYDTIQIYKKNGSLYGEYSGTSLAGVTIALPGDSFSIVLKSDYGTNYYGFSFDSIIAECESELTKPLGHNYSTDWTIDFEPTCTEAGSKSHHCTRCNSKADETVILATGHTAVKVPSVAPTCTTAGKTEGSHCSICNTVLVAQTTVPAKGHTSSDWIFDEYVTCTTGGSKHKECTVCGEVLETVTYPATGHTTGHWIVDVQPTVSAPGSQHKECIDCGKVVETETIPQLKPATPKVATTNEIGGVQVTWNKVDGATKYVVYRRQGGYNTWVNVGATTGNTFLDKNVKSGIYYVYSVRAYNNAGQYSDFVSANTQTRKYMATPKLTTIYNHQNGLAIKWNAVAGITEGYRVYRRGAGSTYWTYLGTTKNLYFIDSQVKNKSGEYFRYTVIANGGYHSKFDTTGLYLKRLANPTLTSAVSSKSGITVKWGAVKGTTGYYVYRKTANSTWTRVGTVGGTNNTTFLDKTAKKGTTYTYTVKAVYGATTSGYNTGISCKDKY